MCQHGYANSHFSVDCLSGSFVINKFLFGISTFFTAAFGANILLLWIFISISNRTFQILVLGLSVNQ